MTLSRWVVSVRDLRRWRGNFYGVYRDIVERLIYTGYIDNTTYQVWGVIWNETGEWPEHITCWCNSYPGNRVLRITDPIGMYCRWVSYREDVPVMLGEPAALSPDCRELFQNVTNLVAKSHPICGPPSPHHGPRYQTRVFPALHLHAERSVRNPLAMFRVPPRLL